MSEETTPRLMCYCLVETIVPLAASADELVGYVHEDRSDIDEAVSDFVDWTYPLVPGLITAGVLPADLAPALRLLRDQALAAAHPAPRKSARQRCSAPSGPPCGRPPAPSSAVSGRWASQSRRSDLDCSVT
jgi:hypothetical protein